MRVAVIGAGGYAGGELLRILLNHPEVTELKAVSRSQAGKTLGEVHPALVLAGEARFAGLESGGGARQRLQSFHAANPTSRETLERFCALADATSS